MNILLKPSSEFKIDVQIDYNSKVLQKSSAQLNKIYLILIKFLMLEHLYFYMKLKIFLNKVLLKEVVLNNAIVFVEEKVNSKELLKLAEIFNKKDIDVKEQGILNNIDLRYENEPARHKLLDVIGDLALLTLYPRTS